MDNYTPRPIEPAGWRARKSEADPLLQEITDLPILRRLALAAAMGTVAWLLFRGAFAIAALNHWIAWAFAVLLLEPLGFLASLAAIYTLFPRSPLGRLLIVALRRAKVVLVALFVTMVGGTALILIWLLWRVYEGQ